MDSSRTGVQIPVQSSVYSMYVIGLTSWADTESLPASSLNSDGQQIVTFRALCDLLTAPVQECRWASRAWSGCSSSVCGSRCLV